MSDQSLLSGVIDNIQLPHQPFLLISDNTIFQGLPIIQELLRRNLSKHSPTLIVTFLHPEVLFPKASSTSTSNDLRVLDFSGSIPGFGGFDSTDISQKILSASSSVLDSSLPPGSQVIIDAIDIYAEDYNPSKALSLVRDLLKLVKSSKPPSRLILRLPSTSPFLTHLLTPTLSPSLTILSPHPPKFIENLSKLYLVPAEASPRFWLILENAVKRRTCLFEALKGEVEGIDVVGDWDSAVVQVLVRKAVGGTKGISRSLEGLVTSPITSFNGGFQNGISSIGGLSIVPLYKVIEINPTSLPSVLYGPGQGQISTHQDLNLPFNLSLTDAQRKQRLGVPLPYAHEGEGGGGGVEMALGDGMGWDEEDDEDDEEV